MESDGISWSRHKIVVGLHQLIGIGHFPVDKQSMDRFKFSIFNVSWKS